MAAYYAPSTAGFYLDDIHQHIPADAVEITEALHRRLLDGQAEGKRIMPPDAAHDLPWLADPPLPTLEEIRAQKLAELNEAFAKAEASGVVQSSLGFPVDATERANRDVSGLITMLERTGKDAAVFCDADNAMRPVTMADLKTVQLEIIAYGQALYAKKWILREAVNAAETEAEIQAIAWTEEDPAAGPENGQPENGRNDGPETSEPPAAAEADQ